MTTHIQIIFYSMYGHIYKMAEAVAAGAREVSGSPYGASTLAGGDGKRMPSENELKIARYQGKHVAEIAQALKIGRGKK